MQKHRKKLNKTRKAILIALPLLAATLVLLFFALFAGFFPDFSSDFSGRQRFEIVAEKHDWLIIEQPQFIINNDLKGLTVRASLLNARNETISLEPEKDFQLNSFLPATFTINKPEKLSPGKYKLKLDFEKKGRIIGREEQDFTWGVLTVNFNKSIYTLEDEKAYIQMGVLNNRGNTICNAGLEMTIVSPSGKTDYFSTDSGTIEYSSECRGDSYSETADYFAYYNLPHSTDKGQAEFGEYRVELTAYTYNGIRTINDSFELREYVPFDVERLGPTRIYPPADYQVKLLIKANQDFTGEIIETVPESFSIFENEITNSKFQITNKVQNSNDQKLKEIVWQVEMEKGETYELSYIFNAPNISPHLYLLGPLRFEQIKP